MSKNLPLKLVKNAWLWGGTGYLLQNYGEKGFTANLWRTIGIISIAYGLHTLVKDLESADE